MPGESTPPERHTGAGPGRGARPALLLTVLLLLSGATAAADQTALDASGVQDALEGLDRIGQTLEHDRPTDDQLTAMSEAVGGYQSRAKDCIASQEAERATLEAQLKTLGPKVAGESAQATAARAKLEHQRSHAILLLSSCRLLQVSSAETLSDLAKRQQQQLASRLLSHGRAATAVLGDWVARPPAASSLVDPGILLSRLGLQAPNMPQWLGALALLGLVIGVAWRRRSRRVTPLDPKQDLARAVFQGIVLSLERYLPGLLVSGAWSLYWLAVGPQPGGWPILASLSFQLFAYLMALSAIRASFRPPPPAPPYLPFRPDLARQFSRSLHWLSVTTLVGGLLLATPIRTAFQPDLVLLARALWGTVMAIDLIRTVWLIRRLRGKGGIGVVRLGIALALLGALAAEWAGYRSLAEFVGAGVVLTLVCLLIALLVVTLGKDLIDSLDEGRHPWERRLRERLGVTDDGFIPGLLWLRILFRLLVWLALGVALLEVWGLPDSAQSTLLKWASQGVSIGQVRIEPARVLAALLALGLLLSLGSWARSQLDRRLSQMRLDRGARETAVAISGYGLMIAAGLIGLSIAGFDLQKIAIIAGALSVGIGFGLQNVVNNFVSGLILLFERPIRTGDWIIVDDVEGYVRRISIRSTQIQTFDRADVIVPNSDLISSRVTNWMLRDRIGRVRVPVGVAYGSDTALVKETLLRVARAHPEVIQDSVLASDPYVLFLEFGDSALSFELRVFVRDVSRRLSIRSELNFAIDSAFREARIEIPFPQRDVHIIRAKEAKEAE